MFYILPFDIDIDFSRKEDLCEKLDEYLGNYNLKIPVQDSTDMIVENITVQDIVKYMKKYKIKFPQLVRRGYELYSSDRYMDITSYGVAKFYNKQSQQEIKIKSSKKSYAEYNKYFSKYIKATRTHIEGDLEYTANTFKVKVSNSPFKLEVTIQGVVDDEFNRIASVLVVNGNLIGYLNPELSFIEDSIDYVIAQFTVKGMGYELVIVSPSSSQAIRIKTNKSLDVKDIQVSKRLIDTAY